VSLKCFWASMSLEKVDQGREIIFLYLILCFFDRFIGVLRWEIGLLSFLGCLLGVFDENY
jgi:hypothetical protein